MRQQDGATLLEILCLNYLFVCLNVIMIMINIHFPIKLLCKLRFNKYFIKIVEEIKIIKIYYNF